MKKILLILVLGLFACKSANNTKAMDAKQKNVLVYYSKGACYGKCPVYDFRVFTDGTAVFTGVKNNRITGNIETKLTTTALEELTQYLKNNLQEPMIFRKIRDLPVTTLRFDDMEYEYHSNKTNGPLKRVETKMKTLVEEIQEGL